MAQERLYIDNIWIPLTKSLNPSITKSITDITELQARKATYSKTVSIPRSKEADKVFSHLFEFNVINNSFNPSLRAAVRYEVDSEIIIEGYIRLNKIGVTNNHEITYDCTMFSTAADFVAEISNGYLSELYYSTSDYEGLDIFDHQLTKELQQLSWATSIIKFGSLEPFAFGFGYVYPLIDFGLSSDTSKFIYTQIAPAIYEKEYLTRMIAWAGYTLQSGGWVDTDDVINHLIIPSSPECYQLTNDDIENREFAANTPELTSTGTSTSNNLPKASLSSPDTIIFTNEISDPGLNYDPSNGKFTVVSSGVYDLNVLIDINATFTPSTGSAVKTVCDVHGFLIFVHTPLSTSVPVQIDSSPFYITSDDSSFTTGARSTSSSPTYPDTDYMLGKAWGKLTQTPPTQRNVDPPDRYQFTGSAIPLLAGDIIEVKWLAGIYGKSLNPFVYNSTLSEFFIDNLGNYWDGNVTLTMAVGSFYNKVANNIMTEGNEIQMSDVIPKNVKMIDYFQSLMRRFNLILDVNPLNPLELILKTKDAYYGSTVINIHEKIDRSKEIESTFVSALDAKRYLYNYKPDVDYWNAKYSANWNGEIYGNRQVDVLTEFANQEKKTEIIFSPTCMVAKPNSDMVLPTIYGADEYNQPKPTKFNIRTLYYAGLKPCLNAWGHTNYVSVFGIPLTDYYTSYPYAGHWDDPFSPTLDINFGLVKEVFYDDNLYPIVTTNNNLVNKYHSKDLRQLTDTDSRIVKAWVHMRPKDFTEFYFYAQYYWDFAYFRLHEVSSYNPSGEETTECTFLKLVDAPTFTATTQTATGKPGDQSPAIPGGNVNLIEQTPAKGTRSYNQPDNNNYSSRSVVVQGEFNYVNSTAKNIEIYGDSNKVFAEANNIKIQGSGNTIDAGVKNVTLINTNNLTVTESDVTYINGVKGTTTGTYTPVDTANVNLDSLTPGVAEYIVSGNQVIVSGTFTADPTAIGVATSFELDLPIPSNIAAVGDLKGVAVSGSVKSESVQVLGSVANDTASFTWITGTNASSRYSYSFQYTIL